MDKKGQKGDRTSLRSISRRSHSLFNSIINLSSGIRPTSQQIFPANSPTTDSSQHSTNSDLVPASSRRKKCGNQSPSSCSSMSSSGGGGGSSTNAQHAQPLGPAPRTFSILTALNELSICEQDQDPNIGKSSRKNWSPGTEKITTRNRMTQHCISSEENTNHSNLASQSQGVIQQSSPQPGEEKLGRSSRKQTLTPCQTGREHEIFLENERNTPNKNRTPEWIWKIFQLAKHGSLHDLKESLKDLDPTLIRHLTDSKGSTLLHCAARGGHLSTLQWLISILGPHLEASLNDHDGARRTPILVALKQRRQECLQWLVLHTKAGNAALVPKDGERSLLHHAASYGDVIAVRWISQCLSQRGIAVDMKDNSFGLTPLCEAARRGNLLVCHELILAGADPVYQTELGWRPVDFAIRQRRLECVNYLMMAETAASVGNELHSRLKEFQTLRQEHDSLRSHFRELLRVAKCMVKERTDLIKNFPSIGSKSSEASLLLGETSNGTRFSDLEHKLVQAEQASKHLNANPAKSVHTVETDRTDSQYNFQIMLAAAQLRCDKMLAANSSPTSEESCLSSASSSEDEIVRESAIFFDAKQPPHKGQVQYRPQSQSAKSTVAPWLLPPNNDSILAQLSPLVSQLDLLGTAPNTLSHTAPNDIDEFGSNHTPRNQSLSPHGYTPPVHDAKLTMQASVLEVIEPSVECIKGTPDLIRETKRGDSVDSGEGDWLHNQGGRVMEETIYSEIRSSSSTSSIKYHSTLDEPVSTDYGHKRSVHHPSPTKCQKHQSFCDTPAVFTEQPRPHPSSKTGFGGQKTPTENYPQSVPSPYSQKSEGSNAKPNFTSGESSSIIHIQSETTIPISSSPQLTFPPEASLEFPHHLFSASQDDISSGNSGQVPPESVSTSNTPVMRRSFSSFSRSSSTVLFPLKKDKWASPELLSSMHTESSVTGRLSPSPSEASRTESALAPPPSHASHESHTSEASKTESARDIGSEEKEYGGNVVQEEEVEPESVETKGIPDIRDGDSRGERKDEEDDEDNQSRKISSLGPMPPQNVQTVQCIMRPLVSSGIHKATIHHVTKSGRRQAKAWYEIEGSDDEEGSLVRKGRSRSSRSSKLSTSSLSNSESENASETSEEHECDPTCPRHNCPDFV